MKAIHELKKEHEAVLVTLNVLEAIMQKIGESGKVLYPGELRQLTDFFREFVDKCHHGKEERHLFPALEAIGVGRNGGPIGQMLDEHQQGRNCIAQMRAVLEKAGTANMADVAHLTGAAGRYIALLRRHIEKENQILFAIAEKHLPLEKDLELQTAFDRIESEEIGQGRHEVFHDMINDLAERFITHKEARETGHQPSQAQGDQHLHE